MHLYVLLSVMVFMRNRLCFLLILVMALWPVMAISSPAQVSQHGQIQHKQLINQNLIQSMMSGAQHDCCEQSSCFCGEDCQCDQQLTNTFGGLLPATFTDSFQNNDIYISELNLFVSNNSEEPFRPPIYL